MEKPYVISQELDLPGVSREQVNLNEIDNFRADLDAELTAMGRNTYWVNSDVISKDINKILNYTKLPVVSLDSRYVQSADQYLGISRGVDQALNDVGYVPRANYPPVQDQLDSISKLGREIVLVDDVVYSGEMMEWLAAELAKRDVKVGAVVCGIAMYDGLAKLIENDIDVYGGTLFEAVEDEICERDFAIVTGSGRRVDSLNANALYFDPLYGKPQQWASIPAEATDEFYINSLLRSAKLLRDDVQMESIGKFVGYSGQGNAKQRIAERLKLSEAQL